MNRKPHVAVVGATGAVGIEMIKTLEKRNFPVGKLTLLASARSAGKMLKYRGEEIAVKELKKDSFGGIDIALFSAGGSISKEYAPIAAEAGCSQQFHDPIVDPLLYWREALRRDPGDTRVNAVLGIVAFGQARYAEAEKYLRKALERLTDRYTTPKDARRSITSALPSKPRARPMKRIPGSTRPPGARPGRPPATIRSRRSPSRAGLRRGARFRDPLDRFERARTFGRRISKPPCCAISAATRRPCTCSPPPPTRPTRWMCAPWRRPTWPPGKEAAQRLASTDELLIPRPRRRPPPNTSMRDSGRTAPTCLCKSHRGGAGQIPHPPHGLLLSGLFRESWGTPRRPSSIIGWPRMPPDYVFPFQNEAIEVFREAIRTNPARCPRALLSGQRLIRLAAGGSHPDVGGVGRARPLVRHRASQSGHRLQAPGIRRRSDQGDCGIRQQCASVG